MRADANEAPKNIFFKNKNQKQMKLIIAIILQAIAFYVLNLVPGIHFTGSFWNAICYGFFFGLVAIVVNLGLMAATAAFGVATGGIGAFIGIILYILGWWIIPAIQLEVLAWWFPKHFAVDGFGYAILGGLVLLVFNFIVKLLTGNGKS